MLDLWNKNVLSDDCHPFMFYLIRAPFVILISEPYKR